MDTRNIYNVCVYNISIKSPLLILGVIKFHDQNMLGKKVLISTIFTNEIIAKLHKLRAFSK